MFICVSSFEFQLPSVLTDGLEKVLSFRASAQKFGAKAQFAEVLSNRQLKQPAIHLPSSPPPDLLTSSLPDLLTSFPPSLLPS